MENNFLNSLKQIIATDRILTDPAALVSYSYDNSRMQNIPLAVIFPINALEIQNIIKLCQSKRIALIARGGASNTTGAVVPITNSIVLSFEKMRAIKNIDTENHFAIVEPGVLNADLQSALKQQGFFWAPNPSSSAYCTIGGNLACNAAGSRAIKYGTCRENTLGLTAITGIGDIIHTGFYTPKGTAGYDLTRLLIGSEGTLGIITEAILKIIPLPQNKHTLQITYRNLTGALRAITKILKQPFIPAALEFMDDTATELVRQHSKINLHPDTQAILFLEIDGNPTQLSEQITLLKHQTACSDRLTFHVAESEEQAKKLWAVRKALSPLLRELAPKKINEDIVVPMSELGKFILFTKELAKNHELIILNFGHAGSGNIHVNILFDDKDPKKEKAADIVLEKIFAHVIKLNGTISGEHGIGLMKKPYMHLQFDQATLNIMQKIKMQFDPNNILNPGKIFD